MIERAARPVPCVPHVTDRVGQSRRCRLLTSCAEIEIDESAEEVDQGACLVVTTDEEFRSIVRRVRGEQKPAA